MDGMIPRIGDNSGVDLVTLEPELIRDQLSVDHANLVTKCAELLGGFDRWTNLHGSGVLDATDAKKTTDFVKQVKTFSATAEATRKVLKAPYDNAAGVVQAFFVANMVTPLKTCATAMERALTAYNERVEAEARRRAQEEAEARRQEADRLAAAARQSGSADLMDEAIAQAEASQAALKLSTGSAADLTRSRGDLGGVSSTTTRWAFEVLDMQALVEAVAAGTAPLRYLMIDEKIIGAEVRARTGVRAIPGLRIYEEKSTRVR